MAITRVRYRNDKGTWLLYLCPVCIHYVSKDDLVWERKPTIGDPGKIKHCKHCNGLWRRTQRRISRP